MSLRNYKPILLLSLLSKVFKRIVIYQANDFLKLNKIFMAQSGFRMNLSKDTCISFLNKKLL